MKIWETSAAESFGFPPKKLFYKNWHFRFWSKTIHRKKLKCIHVKIEISENYSLEDKEEEFGGTL